MLALWNPHIYGISNSSTGTTTEERPVQINYFDKHSITIDGTVHSSTVASVSWFKYHMNKDYYGEHITLWECDILEVGGSNSIIPVQVITRRSFFDDVFQSTASHALFCPCVVF